MSALMDVFMIKKPDKGLKKASFHQTVGAALRFVEAEY